MHARGPSYPFEIDAATGGVAWSEGDQKIAENVRLILGTRHGERPLARAFGTTLHQLVQEPNDGSLGRLIAKQAQEILMQLEPRIVVTDVRVQQHDGELALELRYVHSDRPQADVMVVPLG
ncbi:MAG: GPW/gp25 family protein [Planctomycetota bacterium]